MNANNPDETQGPKEDQTQYNSEHDLGTNESKNVEVPEPAKPVQPFGMTEITFIGPETETDKTTQSTETTEPAEEYVNHQPPTSPTSPTTSQPKWYHNFSLESIVGVIVVGGLTGLIAYSALNSKQIVEIDSIREKSLESTEYTSLVSGENFYHFIREDNSGKNLSTLEEETKLNALKAYNLQNNEITKIYDSQIKDITDKGTNSYETAEKQAKKSWEWDIEKPQTLEPKPKVAETHDDYMKNIQEMNKKFREDIKRYEGKNE